MFNNKNANLGQKDSQTKREYIELLETYLKSHFQKVQNSFKFDKEQYKKYCEEKSANLNPKDFNIVKNHTLDEYFNKYQTPFSKGKVSAYLKDELFLLSKEKKYWEIRNETETFYFEVPSRKKILIPLVSVLAAGAIAGISVGIYFAVRPKPLPPSPPSPYKNEPLTFTCVDDGNDGKASIGLLIYNNNGPTTRNLKYRINNGPWKPINGADNEGNFEIEQLELDEFKTIDVLQDGDTLSKGDKIQFIGDNDTFNILDDPLSPTTMTKLSFYTNLTYEEDDDVFNLSGNVMSLLSSSNFKNLDKIDEPYCFSNLFSDMRGSETAFNYVEAQNLCLPANTLSDFCYSSMFLNCATLLSAPELPANNLAVGCYSYMFFECPSLKTVQEVLPAMNLKEACYCAMFNACSALEVAPELPANNLASYCYAGMFSDCLALKTVQEVLPAKVLMPYCYNAMFNGCNSLEVAPELPATDLSEGCYYSMFSVCYKLEYLKVGFGEENIWPVEGTEYWLSSAGSEASVPKFYWAGDDDPERAIVDEDDSFVPEGWIVSHYN